MDKNQVLSQEWPFEKKCQICGKVFYILDGDMWTYKRTEGGCRVWFCSYSCFRKDQKTHEPEKKRKPEPELKKFEGFSRLRPWQKEILIRNMMRDGMDLDDIRDVTGASYQHVSYYMRKIGKGKENG